MKRSLSVLAVLFMLIVTACSWRVPPGVSEVITGITSRRVGCELVKQNPKIADEVEVLAQALLNGVFEKAAVSRLCALLKTDFDDPLLEADIADVLGLIEIEPGLEVTKEQIALINVVAKGLLEGISYGRTAK